MGLFNFLNAVADIIANGSKNKTSSRISNHRNNDSDRSKTKQVCQGLKLKKIHYKHLYPDRNFVNHIMKIETSYGHDIIGKFDEQYLSLQHDNYIYLNNIPLSVAPSYNRHIEYWLVKNDPQDPSGYSIYWYVPYGDQDEELIGISRLLSKKRAHELCAYLEFIVDFG